MSTEERIKEVLKLSTCEKIARWCQTPKTTNELRRMYEAEQAKSRVAILGGFDFSDYLSQLEGAGGLVYSNGKWQTTEEALSVLAKYFG